MSPTRPYAALALALLATPLLCSCGEDVATIEKMPPSPPATAAGTASGSGTMTQVIWGTDPNTPPERKKVEFAAKYSYAYPAIVDGQRTLWLVVADQPPDTAALNDVDDRSGALRDWCDKQHAKFSALQLDSHNVPMHSSVCAGDGRVDGSRLSADSTASDRGIATLSVNDGKRVEGAFVTGVGSRRVNDKDSIAEISGDYHFAAELAAPTLRDRVLAGGDEKASGVPGAKAAFLKYWKAAGAAKTVDEIKPWFTPERQAKTTQQMGEMAKMGMKPERIMAMFAGGHAGTPSLTAAKAMGAAAVLTAESSDADGKMSCQVLMLQLQGAWKVGDERCAQKK